MTLDSAMLAFIADHPMTKITISYDPFRASCRWTALAYVWRRDGDTQTDAIERLRETLAANTIRTLPVLREGWCLALATPSKSWMPYTHREIANMQAGDHPPKLGPPPPYSIVFDGRGERLYIPEQS